MSPDVVTYTTLMKALIKAEQLDQVSYSHLFLDVKRSSEASGSWKLPN